MPSHQEPEKKVAVSFTNWMLGGSLVSLKSVEPEPAKQKKLKHRKVTITEVDSDDEEIVPAPEKKKDAEKKADKPKEDKIKDDKCDAARDAKDGEKDKEKRVKKCIDGNCKKCGKHKRSGEKKESNKKDESKKDESKKDDSKKDDSKEEKSDESDKAKEDESSGSKSNDDSGWAADQDKKLLDMKAANKSWKEICAEVGCNKSDAQKRFKELSSGQKINNGGDKKNDEKKDKDKFKEGEVPGAFEDDDGFGAGLFAALEDLAPPSSPVQEAANTGGDSSWVTSDANNAADVPDSFFTDAGNSSETKKDGDQNEPQKDGNKSNNGVKMKPKPNGNNGVIGGHNRSNNGGNNGGNGGSNRNNNGGGKEGGNGDGNHNNGGNDGGGGNRGNGGSNGDNGRGNGGGNWNQNSNMWNSGGGGHSNNRGNSGNGQYVSNQAQNSSTWDRSASEVQESFSMGNGGGEDQPYQGKLKPDEIWSPTDCFILEHLKQQQEDQKWLRLQADFYNYTGRMVLAELIERKFRDDDAV